jgi:hypothetical protein
MPINSAIVGSVEGFTGKPSCSSNGSCLISLLQRHGGGKEWESNPPGTSDAPHRI